MDLKEIKTIIELMKRNDLALFQLEREDFKIKLQRGATGPVVALPVASANLTAAPAEGDAHGVPAPAAGGGAPVASSSGAAVAATSVAPAEKLREIVSPMVGTFYQSPSPEAGPFVKVGQTVNEDTVVCIIEAMKVMNEIKAEISGVIAEIVAENSKPVQFGQAMFKVR